MAKQLLADELEKFKEYLRKENNENAKRPLMNPLFQKLFKEKFKIESDAFGADDGNPAGIFDNLRDCELHFYLLLIFFPLKRLPLK